MKSFKVLLFLLILVSGCRSENEKRIFLTELIPEKTPLDFKPELIPSDKIVHKGIFSPDLKEYYYTISDKNFENFDVYKILKLEGIWSRPQKAFFNSDFNDHGMSFSPDGNTLYFSSTRPTMIEEVPSTWHIWKSEKSNGVWSEPIFVDIPNLRDKLVSHPTITTSGKLYFHSSNLDYSEMDIYESQKTKGTFGKARRVSFSTNDGKGNCTPFVSPEGDYLIFTAIQDQLNLMISFRDDQGNWSDPEKLSDQINQDGQGNPYVTPDHQFLFFTAGKNQDQSWKVKWVRFKSELKKKQEY